MSSVCSACAARCKGEFPSCVAAISHMGRTRSEQDKRQPQAGTHHTHTPHTTHTHTYTLCAPRRMYHLPQCGTPAVPAQRFEERPSCLPRQLSKQRPAWERATWPAPQGTHSRYARTITQHHHASPKPGIPCRSLVPLPAVEHLSATSDKPPNQTKQQQANTHHNRQFMKGLKCHVTSFD